MSKLIVYIESDPDIDCPSDADCQWTLHSFGRRHNNFVDPEKLGLGEIDHETREPKFVGILGRKLKAKFKVGLAFFLSYYEHGSSVWFRKGGDVPAGIEFQWDGVRVAGLLVWKHPAHKIGAKTMEEREKDADCFLTEYTAWANGEGYYYRIEDEDGNEVDSCGGYLGDPERMLDDIARGLALVGHEFTVTGEASYLGKDLRRLVKAKSKKTPTV